MICPSCKKNMTSIIKDIFIKKNNSVKRERYCKCGFLFITFEKFKSVRTNRKIRPNTHWKNERMFIYGMYRYNSAVDAYKRLIKKHNIKSYSFYGKSKVKFISLSESIKSKEDFQNIKSNEKYKNLDLKIFYKESKGKANIGIETKEKKYLYPLETKSKTILNILKEPTYWEMREAILGKTIKDFENKDKFRKELNEYYKSVVSYIKNDDFNQKFFIKMSGGNKNFWKDNQVWSIYITVR